MKKLPLLLMLCVLTSLAYAQDEFITTWETTTANESITIPVAGTGHNFTVDWDNDGVFDEINLTGSNPTHTYPTPGIHTVVIEGILPRIFFNLSGDREKIISVEQWGNIPWTSMEDAFSGCTNLIINAIDAPVLTNVTSIARMFFLCTNINQSFNHWDVSTITNMSGTFTNTSFNQSLTNWNVSNLTNASSLFSGTPFNQDLSSWNVSNVEEFGGMFQNATAFNQDISGWNVASATEMQSMFNGATAFIQDITGWDVSGVEFMQFMFANTASFNQDISNWDVSSATNMRGMFQNATAFNQDISSWDVSIVNNVSTMFDGANAFDKNIGSWDISSVTDATDMFANTNLSVVNYDALLTGWSTLDAGETQIPLNLNFSAGTSNYCNATTERNNLINTYGWSVTDGGLGCLTPETNVDFTAGILSITDTGVQDDFVYTLTSNNDMLIFYSSISGISVNGTGITNIDDHTLEIPLASITSGLIIDGVNEEEGSVNLNIDYNFTTANVTVNNAVYINQSGDLQTTTGNITFLAKGGTTVDGNVETTTGQITMHGFSEGINIIATADFTDPWGFMLQDATYETHGVHITSNASIHTVSGGIELYGTATRGGTEATVRHGVYIQGTLTTTGTGVVGEVDIMGRGQLSGYSSTGVNIENAIISTVDAPLNFWGLGAINGRTLDYVASGRRYSEGVYVHASNISSTGVGSMDFYGKSGENLQDWGYPSNINPYASDGVEINDSNLSSTDGNITIEGVLNDVNVDFTNRQAGDAVRVDKGSIIASGNGNITLTGEGHQTDLLPGDDNNGPISDGVNISSQRNFIPPLIGQLTIQTHDGDITINTKRGKLGLWLNNTSLGLRAFLSATGMGNININAYASVFEFIPNAVNIKYTLAFGALTQAPIITENGDININAFTDDGVPGSIYFGSARPFTINGTGNLNIFADDVENLGDCTTRLFGGGSVNVTTDIYTVRDDRCETIILDDFTIIPKTTGSSIGVGDNAVGDLNLLNYAFCPTAIAANNIIGDATSGDVDLNTFSIETPMTIMGKNFTVSNFSTGDNPLHLISTPDFHIQESDPLSTAITASNLVIDGVLSPGNLNMQGIFNVVGDVTLSDNDTYIVDLINTGNTLDQLKLQGTTPTLVLNNANLVVTTSLYTPVVNEEIVIIDIEGINTAIGTFNGLAEGDTILVDGEIFVISYLGGDGNDVSLTNQSTLGLPNTELSTSISIFPNPAKAQFILKNNGLIALKNLDIYETTGRLVKTLTLNKTSESFEIDVSELSSGTYFIIIHSAQGHVTKKLIKE